MNVSTSSRASTASVRPERNASPSTTAWTRREVASEARWPICSGANRPPQRSSVRSVPANTSARCRPGRWRTRHLQPRRRLRPPPLREHSRRLLRPLSGRVLRRRRQTVPSRRPRRPPGGQRRHASCNKRSRPIRRASMAGWRGEPPRARPYRPCRRAPRHRCPGAERATSGGRRAAAPPTGCRHRRGRAAAPWRSASRPLRAAAGHARSHPSPWA